MQGTLLFPVITQVLVLTVALLGAYQDSHFLGDETEAENSCLISNSDPSFLIPKSTFFFLALQNVILLILVRLYLQNLELIFCNF